MSTIEIMAQMENDIMVRVIEHLNRGSVGSAAWEAKKLQQLGVLNEELVKIVATGTDEAILAMSKELEAGGRAAVQAIDTRVPSSMSSALRPNADDQLKTVFTAWDNVAANQLNQVGASMIKSASTIYTDIATKVTGEVLTGSMTGRQAMSQAAKQWADKGIPALIDKAGRKWTTEAYTQTLVRTNVRNVSTGVQTERLDQYGLDLMEVSSHVGARENCAPYQGKIYSRSGNSNNYPPLSSTSMGDIDGLFGINCQHPMYPYIPGEKKTFKPIPKKQNEEAYKNSQKQRGIERGIRRSKREADMLNAVGDKAGARVAQETVRNQQAAMRDFLNKTGRTRRREREQLL